MSSVISTKLKLSDGKIATGYYITEKGREELRALLAKVSNHLNRIQKLENRADLLLEANREAIIKLNMTRIATKLPLAKSVHRWTFLSELSHDYGYDYQIWIFLDEAWERLEAKGCIESRGSGWYRKK